jgi:hypothetical protein
MRCHRAQRDLSEYVDGSLAGRKRARLERHLAACPACRQVLEDFRAITDVAPALAGPELRASVWPRIRARLEALEMEPSRAGVPVPGRRAFGWGMPALKFAGVAAIILMLAASGVFFGLRLGKRGVPERIADPEKYTLAKLDAAEHDCQKAIRSLSEAFAARQGTIAPQVADIFERNLAVVDATIQTCRQDVLKNPDNLQARNYLLAAYMDKVSVLDAALDFESGRPGPRGQGVNG